MRKYAKIGGMTCEHCASRIIRALSEIEGISNVEIDLKKQVAVFEADAEVNNQEIIDMVEGEGYEVKEVDWE
jgi:copper chaperone CopZ